MSETGRSAGVSTPSSAVAARTTERVAAAPATRCGKPTAPAPEADGERLHTADDDPLRKADGTRSGEADGYPPWHGRRLPAPGRPM
ncbi:hypothetical protein ACFVIM_32055, partial [Streptomyces sp. NPDC057638]